MPLDCFSGTLGPSITATSSPCSPLRRPDHTDSPKKKLHQQGRSTVDHLFAVSEFLRVGRFSGCGEVARKKLTAPFWISKRRMTLCFAMGFGNVFLMWEFVGSCGACSGICMRL